MLDFKGKVVLVTGGSRGIGQAISHKFAELGAHVIINYRANKSAAEETFKSLLGEGHLLLQADVTDPAAVKKLISKAHKHKGALDIVVNNAGIAFHHQLGEVGYSKWRKSWAKTLEANLIAPANICHQAAQKMITQGFGTIINVSSRGAFRGEPLMPAYGASKAALNSLTQSLAFDLAPKGIFVGAVAPGFVETDMAKPRLLGATGEAIKSQSPLHRVAQPGEVAQAVVLMAASPIWMTGGIFDVNGASYFRV